MNETELTQLLAKKASCIDSPLGELKHFRFGIQGSRRSVEAIFTGREGDKFKHILSIDRNSGELVFTSQLSVRDLDREAIANILGAWGESLDPEDRERLEAHLQGDNEKKVT